MLLTALGLRPTSAKGDALGLDVVGVAEEHDGVARLALTGECSMSLDGWTCRTTRTAKSVFASGCNHWESVVEVEIG